MPLNPKAIPFTIDASKNTLQQKLAETERLISEKQRELEIYKQREEKWRNQCEKLLMENASLRKDHDNIMRSKLDSMKCHQKAWANDFSDSSSDEE